MDINANIYQQTRVSQELGQEEGHGAAARARLEHSRVASDLEQQGHEAEDGEVGGDGRLLLERDVLVGGWAAEAGVLGEEVEGDAAGAAVARLGEDVLVEDGERVVAEDVVGGELDELVGDGRLFGELGNGPAAKRRRK